MYCSLRTHSYLFPLFVNYYLNRKGYGPYYSGDRKVVLFAVNVRVSYGPKLGRAVEHGNETGWQLYLRGFNADVFRPIFQAGDIRGEERICHVPFGFSTIVVVAC